MSKELPGVLKGLVKEILRSQPEDIYTFGAEYFAELQRQATEPATRRRLTTEELKELLANLFKSADVDNSGALSLMEFKTVLQQVDLGLGDRELKRVMAEADFDGNGEISYEEFIPLAIDLVQSMYAKIEAESDRKQEEDAAREEAKHHLLHGMTKEQVEGVMMEIFHKSDADGSGALSLTEFQKCCRDADIGLTRKEVNILMHSCDVDGDGSISYEEFVPLCFEMLTEILKDELLQEKRSPSELEVFLCQSWEQADPDATNVIDAITLKQCLKNCDLGLTRLQIHSILAEADYDEEGFAEYKKFAPKAAELIYRILDLESQHQKAEAVNALLQDGQTFEKVKGKTQVELELQLNADFTAADPAGSGTLSVADVRKVLIASPLQLTQAEVMGLVSAADPQEGVCFYAGLSSYAFYILQYLAQQAAVAI